ncbi:MAG: cob(I)yrinic acid a,c-diamide adenosyltransferase [Candidatus Woesearchaeota archaeon]|nr:cob(I)yrinic acid a,c-diamide adenosyltransferase [Candidatus Woesearchaeota archaeon]
MGKFDINISDLNITSDKNGKVKLEKGLVHVYYGEGRGKTSVALGTALRACGHGMRVKVVQLLKGFNSIGECMMQDEISELEIKQFGNGAYIFEGSVKNKDKEMALFGLSEAEKSMKSGNYDVIIVDEAIYALEFGLIPTEKIIRLINEKPNDVELILTGGRNPPKEVLELADYVSHLVLEKHPYQKGIKARMGIDF